MAINEAEFDAALAEFITALDDTLNIIQEKLNSIGSEVDFTDELDTLTSAKGRLTDFVAANSEATPVDTGTVEPGTEV